MKTYKLKKDLPLAKAGTIVTLEVESTNGQIQSEDGNVILANINITDTSEWLEEIQEKSKNIWNLKQGDDFYFIFNNSVRKNFITNYEPFIIYHLAEGNVFVTKEEAEQELKKRQAIQRIKKYCWENDIDLSNKFKCIDYIYSIVYTLKTNKSNGCYYGPYVDSCDNNGNSIGFFKTATDAQKVIKNCEDELKLIFNV